MALISSSIPNLINGISQQPDTLRLASQAEDQVNFLSSVADGLTVRPPTRTLKRIASQDWSDAFLHTINRDVIERYIVAIRQGTLRVFEAQTGIERTVNAPNGFGYLTGAAENDYKAVTVADYTFITNRNVTARASTQLLPERPKQALVIQKAANYSSGYNIFLNNNLVASYGTVPAVDASSAAFIQTGFVASVMLALMAQHFGMSIQTGSEGQAIDQSAENATWRFERSGDLILITNKAGNDFTVRTEDNKGGIDLDVIEASVQRFSDLPEKCFDGFEVEIVGDASSSFDNYHVKYETTDSASVQGVWKEAAKGGESYKLDPLTMPHTLVREANGTFTFEAPDWAPRECGDLDKVPHPSCVNRKIRDIFFFQNRLGFCADENVVMSQDGEYFDFYRSTATTILDTDPVDVAIASEKVSILNYAVPFNRTLLLFSDQSQFVLEGGQIFTPQTVAVAQATSFENYTNVRPVGVGQYIYFPVPRGSNAGLREYFVQEGNEQNDAIDVTSHVPRYLPRSITSMAASSSEDTLVMLADDERNSMWIYRFFFNAEGKLQSAWSKWQWAAEDMILSAEFIESTLYMVVTRNNETFIDTISFESGKMDLNSSFLFRLDRGVDSHATSGQTIVTSVYDGEWTTWTMPFPTNETFTAVTRGDDPELPEGLILPTDKVDSRRFRMKGDQQARRFMAGIPYTATYTFSTFYMRSAEPGGGLSANSNGRMQIRYLSIDYDRTAFFRIQSTPRGRQMTEKVFSGRVLGGDGGVTGEVNLATGRFRMPIQCRNTDAHIQIVCDSPLPASFTAAEWEATYTARSRKV